MTPMQVYILVFFQFVLSAKTDSRAAFELPSLCLKPGAELVVSKRTEEYRYALLLLFNSTKELQHQPNNAIIEEVKKRCLVFKAPNFLPEFLDSEEIDDAIFEIEKISFESVRLEKQTLLKLLHDKKAKIESEVKKLPSYLMNSSPFKAALGLPDNIFAPFLLDIYNSWPYLARTLAQIRSSLPIEETPILPKQEPSQGFQQLEEIASDYCKGVVPVSNIKVPGIISNNCLLHFFATYKGKSTMDFSSALQIAIELESISPELSSAERMNKRRVATQTVNGQTLDNVLSSIILILAIASWYITTIIVWLLLLMFTIKSLNNSKKWWNMQRTLKHISSGSVEVESNK